METELGYQILYTGFTGTYNSTLSGNEFFPIINNDRGTAENLFQGEGLN